jgi:hypothetical protein
LRRGPAAAAIILAVTLAPTPGSLPALYADGRTSMAFGGYLKSFSIVLAPPALRLGGEWLDQEALGAMVDRLRLKLSLSSGRTFGFDLAYDVAPRIQDRRLWDGGLSLPGLAPADYRFADLRDRLFPGPDRTPRSFGVTQNLDRCVLSFKPKAADILLGRQAIAWGSGRVVNPTDVLAPFAFNELDKEERRGVDALRVRVPLGAMDELDVGAVAGDRFKPANDAFYVRGKGHAAKIDFAGLAMAFRGHLLVGLDLARSLGGAGSWLEAALVVPDAFRPERTPGERSYVRVSTGLDYTFRGGTYAFVEYHFNSAGAAAPDAYLALFDTTAYRDGAAYLLGRHYMNAGTTIQITPLLPFTGLIIANLNDGSFILAPSADYNVAENVYLALGAYLGIGRRPEAAPDFPLDAPVPGLFRSEFGAYPAMVFASFRLYF